MSNTNGSLASVDGAAHVIGLVPKNLYNISHTQAESCVEWKPKCTDTYVCLSHSYTIEEMATSVLCLFHFYCLSPEFSIMEGQLVQPIEI